MGIPLVASGRLTYRAIPICLIFVLFTIFFFYYQHNFLTPAPAIHDNPATVEAIPNFVHFAYVLGDPNGEFRFKFSHFLSIYAASFYWRPEAIYLHTNAEANGTAVGKARAGQSGKWDRLIFTLFDNLNINTMEVPMYAGNGVEIQGLEHKSDFIRVKAIHDIGGVYIDWDVHALRDIRVLREAGFKAIAGRQLGGQINSGTFMSEKKGKLVKLWMDGMHEAYTGGWTTHSNEVITKFGQRLIREPGEMLIMERDAFAPGSWNDEDTDYLFRVHDDEPSNIENLGEEPLPLYEESFDDRWNHPDRYPEWSHDWSSSYLLHAFTPDRWGHQVEGYQHITPRYVLERRSNFARAVYPIAQHLHEKGIISVDDEHTG